MAIMQMRLGTGISRNGRMKSLQLRKCKVQIFPVSSQKSLQGYVNSEKVFVPLFGNRSLLVR